jgi:deazaflavin-dependent oxidoreductase (nitroreductase family)
MILTTRGHRSGQPRYTPIEYRRHGRKYYAISAWGSRPHWYRNLSADPNVTLCQGKRTFAAQARVIENSSEALMVLHLFRRPNPLVYDAILARLGQVQSLDPRLLPDLAHQYTIIRFDPQPDDPALPSPNDDLRWLVWVVSLAGLLFVTMSVLRGRRPQPTEPHHD